MKQLFGLHVGMLISCLGLDGVRHNFPIVKFTQDQNNGTWWADCGERLWLIGKDNQSWWSQSKWYPIK